MGLDGKNIKNPVTKISVQILKLLMGVVEQHDPSIAHRVLLSELGDEEAKFLLKENFLTKGQNLEHYWDGDDDKYVEWYDHLNSFAYLSLSGLIEVTEDDLKTYDANFSRFTDFLVTELDVLPSSKVKANEYIEGLLYFVGNIQIGRKKLAVFFARRLGDHNVFKKIEEFFVKQSPIRLPKLILTSSTHFYPESLRENKAAIISIPKLLDLSANNKTLFNIDYINGVVFGGEIDSKPYVHCLEDGSILFVGDKHWDIKGQNQRQVIKAMCELYLENPDSKMRWNAILSIADLDETSSRFVDLFKKSSVKDVIEHGNGFVWFKTEENS